MTVPDETPPIVHPEVAFRDDRGSITDIIEGETFDSVSLITTAAGSVRGNHYHLETNQVIYVLSGRLRVVRQIPGGSVVTQEAGPGDLVRTPPAEHHAFQAIEDSAMFVLTRGPRGGHNYETDTIRLDDPLIDG